MPSEMPFVVQPEQAGAPDSKILSHAVRKILDSPLFQRSHRLSQLLAYLVDRTLEQDTESLKECAIGHYVFGRPATYNTAEDNIVRSNIHQLRLKLAEYYAAAGAADAFRVSVPKGSYGLVVEPRPATLIAESPNIAPPRPQLLPARTRSRSLVVVSCLAVIAAVSFSLYLGARRAGIATPGSRCLLGLLAPNPGQRLMIVVPDATVQLYQALTGRTVSVQDYVDHRFIQADHLRGISPVLADSAAALFHQSVTQSFVLDLIPRFIQAMPATNLCARNGDTLNMKDFEKDNAVLISGPFGDPWVQLFDRNLNFQIETLDPKRSAHIVDQKPEGSESHLYYDFVDRSGTTVSYARIAYLPGLTAGTRVLLAGGPHIASTKAACEFLTRPESMASLRTLFHATGLRNFPYFELLIAARELGNAPWQMRVLASRVLPSR